MNRMLILTLIFFPLLNGILAERNRLIRVDGINPTCFERPKCKEFDLIGAVVSVDKSLPYMGSNYCCLTFNMLRLDNYETEGKFMARVLNTTVLEGNDYISFFDADFNIIRNITVDDMEPYTIVYFDTPTVSVEVYKDRNYRSKYEIAFTTYYEPESSLCYKSSLFHRCGPTNKSICIDEELTCDKFEHCPSGNDEEHCGQLNETAVNYDKLTVTIVLSFIMSVIVFTIFSILLLCFFKSNTTLSRAFMSIFGHKNKSQNSAMLEASLKHEQRLSLIADSDTPAKMSYHV